MMPLPAHAETLKNMISPVVDSKLTKVPEQVVFDFVIAETKLKPLIELGGSSFVVQHGSDSHAVSRGLAIKL